MFIHKNTFVDELNLVVRFFHSLRDHVFHLADRLVSAEVILHFEYLFVRGLEDDLHHTQKNFKQIIYPDKLYATWTTSISRIFHLLSLA